MSSEQARRYLQKYNDGTASSEESAMVESWLLEFPLDDRDVLDAELKAADLAEIRANLMELSSPKRIEQRLWPRIAVAAAAIAAIVFGIWFYLANPIINRQSETANQNGIVPGKNTAILSLNNGKTIHLSDAKTGVVIDANKLAYNDGTEISTVDATTLTASTPRGGQYQITLPDGTKVWLNAATILRFPSTFNNSSDRKVELSGEAYFEVAKDKKHPFIVQTKEEEITVLGTHFNVNSYEDEYNGTIASLLEGAVKMSNENGSKILKPGERAIGTIKGIMLLNGNATDDVAWKDGQFVFVNEPIESIMKKIARWYDVEVVYQGDMSKQVFVGTISRYDKISEVLNMLSATNTIHFKVQGRRIIVMD